MPISAPGKIVVVGSLNLDFVLRVSRMPAPGETMAAESSATFSGGKGANQAVACARMGARVAMVGRLGADPAGDMLRSALIAEGIDAEGVLATPESASGAAAILLTPDGQNRIIIAAGANGRVTPADVAAQSAAFEGAGLLVCQLEVPMETVAAAISAAHARGIKVLLNPAPAQALPDHLIPKIDYMVVNETEATMLTGIEVTDPTSATTAAAELRRQGARTVIVTLGAGGVLYGGDFGATHLNALPAKVVDTTAAGDSFIGGFAAGLTEGMALSDAVMLGLSAARICVGREGAQASLPRRSEI
jgi:ribokinase